MHALLQTMLVAQRCKFNALFVTLSTPIGYPLRIIEHLFISTGLSLNRGSYASRELHYYFGIRIVHAFIVYITSDAILRAIQLMVLIITSVPCPNTSRCLLRSPKCGKLSRLSLYFQYRLRVARSSLEWLHSFSVHDTHLHICPTHMRAPVARVPRVSVLR